ncbi:hypothetical protein FBY04_1208 [Pseudomonas sp. SJZ080]|uniref:hypothetical protein n=1 Tax=Pseudomonas sp. SJZ080 TaxID=2572888 RepID=UPI001199DF60|nr:hypothetical protein [Pseudomonas sp. SJZ080]TWC50115.1 hypothetical protein FBY04_1208 [Pseudomonas sp. SJZ080]
MSWLDGMVEENEALSQNERLGRTADKPAPGAFTGALDVLGPSLLRGGLEAGAAVESGFSSLWQTGLDAAANVLLPEPKFGGKPNVTSAEESSQETLGQGTAQAVMDLRPDPAEVGVVGQILGEAAAILPRTVVGTVLAGPVGAGLAAGGPAGYASKQVGMAEGLDESTATLKGVIDAATVGVGAVLPAARFVKPLLGDAAIAVGANVGLGMAGRGATAELLDGGGYHAQAAQYRAMDGTAIATDAILGAAFFGIGRAGLRRPTTEQVDAALSERTYQHADIDTAPGAPINPRSAVAHQDAIRTAIGQLSRGEPVVLPESIHSAQFMRTAEKSSVVAPTRDVALATAKQDLEPTLRMQLEQEAAGILPNVKDVRAELGTLKQSIDGLDDTFRARAKEFQAQGQSRKRAEQSARQAIDAERLELSDRQTALNESLTGNRTAELARADLAAMNRGETPSRFDDRVNQRADAIVQGFEKKPLAAGVAEANTRQSMAQIAQQEIRRILDDIERAEPTLQAKPLDIGRPVDAPKAGKNAQAPAKNASEPAKVATTGGKDASAPPKDAAPSKGEQPDADPVVQVADEILSRMDDMRLSTGALDADGNPITVSARELMAQADADIVRAQEESRGFVAAAACFLQRG